MHGAHNTCRNAFILSVKNAHALVHARLCNGAETFLPWKLLRTFLEYARASCRLSFAARPPAVSTKSVARRCSCKSTLAHDAVSAAVWHKHHSIICVGAGLIQFVYGSHSKQTFALRFGTRSIHVP